MTTEILSRMQFAFTITFHILFPSLSIGLACFLSIMEGLYLRTGHELYKRICQFWTKVFALTFGMGVVSGIVMEFQLGTNWAGYAKQVGGVLGSLFTYEVMTAFFIEAGFLGVMLFGWDRVGKRLHYLATLLVTVGTTLSAYWIMAANTWMQHPVGYVLKDGAFQAVDWPAIIFNAELLVRFLHMLLAAYISAGFVISAVCAYYLLRKRHVYFARRCFRFVWVSFVLLVPLQLVIGDMNGESVHEHQPIKTAAMEGLWKTQKGAPFLPIAIIDQAQQKNTWSIKIPHMAAFINTHQWDGELMGLDAVPREDQPNVPMVFYAFRVMVGVGLLMLGMMMFSLWLRWKNRLYDHPWFLRACCLSAPLGFIAMETGWITAEVGRQPWVVYGFLRTADAVSHISVKHVWFSFGLMVVVYGIIFGFFYTRFLRRIIQKGPAKMVGEPPRDQPFHYIHILPGDYQ